LQYPTKENIMNHAENYDELADRLTGEAPVEGKGKALHGDEAAAHGRRMIANAITPEQFAQLPKDLAESLNEHMFEEMRELVNKTPSTLQFGGALSGKVLIPDTTQQDQDEEE
jgi:hypothetical protein